MKRDENYVPYTCSEYNLPDAKEATKADYAEVFEETPLFTLTHMFIMQGL
jgi:omega-6 fatty acid desaturase (delta-12 desaturase)